MRIKHWQGYGLLNAEKVSDNTYKTGEYVRTTEGIYHAPRVIQIRVTGDHEWGLDRHYDKYDCYNWLLKRFVKGSAEEDILCIEYEENYLKHTADYYFILKTEESY